MNIGGNNDYSVNKFFEQISQGAVGDNSEQVEAGYVKKADPTKTDSISATQIIERQNIALTGERIPVNASHPNLFMPLVLSHEGGIPSNMMSPMGKNYPPLENMTPEEMINFVIDYQTELAMQDLGIKMDKAIEQNKQARGGEGDPVKQVASNPWFNVSFLAVFTSIVDELLNLNRKTAYLEAQNELKARANVMALTKTQSELTKMITDAEVQAKITEGISHFVQAGIAGVALCVTWANAATARKQTVEQVKQDKATAQDEINKLKYEKTQIQDRPLNERMNAVRVSSDPNAMTNLPPPRDLTNAEKARIQEIDKAVDIKQGDITRSMTPQSLREAILRRQQHLDQQSGQMKDIVSQVASGCSQFIQAAITSQRGSLEALKQMNDGFLQLLNKYLDSSAKASESSKTHYRELMDFVNKLVDSTYRAHALGNMA